MQTLNVLKITWKLKFIWKTLTLPEHGNIILNTEPKKRKMGFPYFEYSWRYHCISCFHFCFFLFRNNVKREQMDKNDFRHCFGNEFSKVSFWNYNVLSQRLWGTLTTTSERTLQLKILQIWINIGVKPALRRTLHQCM